MIPTIRIDQDIYDYLNEKGKTEDTFNDVLRRQLGLDQKSESKRRIRHTLFGNPDGRRSKVDGKLREIIDKHLPPRWSDTPAREAQIVEVIENVLASPRDWPIQDRDISARKAVAQRRGIDPNSVLDKYGRQLYGDGGGQVWRFRAALEKIENDLDEESLVY